MLLTETEQKQIREEAERLYPIKKHKPEDFANGKYNPLDNAIAVLMQQAHETAVTAEREKAKVLLDALRKSFSKYVKTEVCSCCEDEVPHSIAAAEIGELLGFEKYKDGSGYNFYELPINNTTNEQ